MSTLVEGTYRIIDSKTRKPRAQVFKTLAGANAKAKHLEDCHGRRFDVAKAVATPESARDREAHDAKLPYTVVRNGVVLSHHGTRNLGMTAFQRVTLRAGDELELLHQGRHVIAHHREPARRR